jgi:uncharacterized membrane protein YfcA
MLVFGLFIILGIIAAAFGSLLGLGGGIIIVPALIYLSPTLFNGGLLASTAVGTSMVVLSFTAFSSSLTYIKAKKVDFKSAWIFFIGSGPAAIVGALGTQAFKPETLQLAFGLFMLLITAIMVARDYMKPLTISWKITRRYVQADGQVSIFGYSYFAVLSVGCLVGLFSGLFGIGGGSLMIPVMVILFRYPPHIATATSMFVILMSSLLGSGTHIVQGDVSWGILVPLAIGALVGGWLGALLSTKLSGKMLIWILRVSFLLIAVDFIWLK